MKFEYTWRWFGPNDPVSILDVKQTGATGIVTSLHHISTGETWSLEEIQKRIDIIEKNGLHWAVVESVPVHEDIKKRSGNYKKWIENYKATIDNLALCGIKTICYNFMPVLDWTRTDLEFPTGNGSTGLRFNQDAFVAFELYLLNRSGAEEEYSNDQIKRAKSYFDKLNEDNKKELISNIIAGLPGGHEEYSLEEFRTILHEYTSIDKEDLRSNLTHFLKEIIPVAEKNGVRMAIHPDDPPYPILGLPRIISTEIDIQWLLNTVQSDSNGLTFCTGSYGVRSDNDLTGIAERYGLNIYFLHFRSVQREEDGSFYEADHLEGDSKIAEVMYTLIQTFSSDERSIPLRPDHGHKMLDDLKKKTNPGYSCIGRLDGLAKLKGLEKGLRYIYEDSRKIFFD